MSEKGGRCELTTHDGRNMWCARHLRRHLGWEHFWSQRETPDAELVRKQWDEEIRDASKEAPTPKGLQRILLKMGQIAPGDLTVLTATIEAVAHHYPGRFLFALECCAPEIFAHNPHCLPQLASPDKVVTMHYHKHLWEAHWRTARYLNGYTEWINQELGLKIPSAMVRPYLYLSAEELARPRRMKEPYVVINSGWKADFPLKNWGFDNWCRVVDWVRAELGLAVVQVGEHHHAPRVIPGAINLIGQTSHRDLFLLAFYSEFGLAHESYLHHIYAGFAKPCVCVSHGYFMKTWPSHVTEQYLTRQGTMSCCPLAGCGKMGIGNISPSGKKQDYCTFPAKVGDEHVGQCMAAIPPEEVIAAIKQWYGRGGVLSPEAKAIKPGLFAQAANMAKAIVKDVAGGRRRLDEAAYQARLNVCTACDQLDPLRKRCKTCGCDVLTKAAWAGESCPLGKWPGPFLTVGTLYTDGFQHGEQAAAALAVYAEKQGYPCVIKTRSLDEKRHPSWSKIKLIADHFRAHPGAGWFLWVDADAHIMNQDIDAARFLDRCYDLVVCADRPPNAWNSGVFAIRNSATTLDFLDRVWAWQGEAEFWEQSAMQAIAADAPIRVKVLPRRTLQSFADEYAPGDFIRHMAGWPKKE